MRQSLVRLTCSHFTCCEASSHNPFPTVDQSALGTHPTLRRCAVGALSGSRTRLIAVLQTAPRPTWIQRMACTGGFEPPELSSSCFRGRCHKPLDHVHTAPAVGFEPTGLSTGCFQGNCHKPLDHAGKISTVFHGPRAMGFMWCGPSDLNRLLYAVVSGITCTPHQRRIMPVNRRYVNPAPQPCWHPHQQHDCLHEMLQHGFYLL